MALKSAEKCILPREIQIIATEYITQHTSKDLQNIPFQRLKGPLKHSAVCLVSAARPLPDYCQLKGDWCCNSPRSDLLDQERPFKTNPFVAIMRVVEKSLRYLGREMNGTACLLSLSFGYMCALF